MKMGKRRKQQGGVKAKASSSQRSMKTCFSQLELTSLKQLSLLLVKLSLHIQINSFPLTYFGQLKLQACAQWGKGRSFSSNSEFLYCCWDRSCVSVMPGMESLAVPNRHQAVLRAGFALQMLASLLPPVLSHTPIVLLLLSVFPRLHQVNYSGLVCPAHSFVCHHAFSPISLSLKSHSLLSLVAGLAQTEWETLYSRNHISVYIREISAYVSDA